MLQACRIGLAALALVLNAGSARAQGAVVLVAQGPNAVSAWHELAVRVIAVPPSAAGTTPAERHAGPDLETLQIAVYDAAVAITATHRPFAIEPKTPAAGASVEAAVNEAAYRVLAALFPSRSALYRPTYDERMAALADGDAKTRGAAIGAEVAAGVLALRAGDGRDVALPPYVPGSAPGAYRGRNPIGRAMPYWRPFALSSAAQFRPAPPPALTSSVYARDFDESKATGGAVSALRTSAQFDAARFHTEPPGAMIPRNLRRLAASQPALADNARLLAMLSVAVNDASIGCFEAKYRYDFWRPLSAIPLADTDGNPATAPDPAWTPALPTPPHPEYPAGHGCAMGAVAEVLRQFFGTGEVAFEWDSSVTGTTRRYATTDALLREVFDARVHGGMHFRNSIEAGAQLGRETAQWIAARHFGRR